MFSSFWEWILIIIVIALIFGANNINLWKAMISKKLDSVKKTALDKKAEIEQKLKDNKKDK